MNCTVAAPRYAALCAGDRAPIAQPRAFKCEHYPVIPERPRCANGRKRRLGLGTKGISRRAGGSHSIILNSPLDLKNFSLTNFRMLWQGPKPEAVLVDKRGEPIQQQIRHFGLSAEWGVSTEQTGIRHCALFGWRFNVWCCSRAVAVWLLCIGTNSSDL